MLDTAEPAIAASATEPAVSRPVGHRPFDALAAHIASPGTSTGERAALARLSPGQPLRPHEVAALARALIALSLRTQRDATLEMPVLILPSVQVNIRAGELPPPEANGVTYLKIPVNAL